MKKFILILIVLISVNCFGQSYSNPGGTGNRTASITVTTNAAIFNTIDKLIDGVLTKNLAFKSQPTAGKFIAFDFKAAKIITEITFKQEFAKSHGMWKVQVSNDNIGWVDISNPFDFGITATQVIPTTIITSGSGYRYYRMLGISGNIVQAAYQYEMEFKIADAATIPIPTIPGVDFTQIKTYMNSKLDSFYNSLFDLTLKIIGKDTSVSMQFKGIKVKVPATKDNQ